MSLNADAEARAIGQAMSDPGFRKRLLADPVPTLRGAGVEVPDGVSVQVVEDTATLVHVVLPALAGDEAIIDSDLERVVGGRAGRCQEPSGGCFLNTG